MMVPSYSDTLDDNLSKLDLPWRPRRGQEPPSVGAVWRSAAVPYHAGARKVIFLAVTATCWRILRTVSFSFVMVRLSRETYERLSSACQAFRSRAAMKGLR